MSLSATTGAILVSKDFQVVVWANQPRLRSHKDDPWRRTLTYYSFWDDKRFTHLDALLTRLAPIDLLHTACTEKIMDNNTMTARKKAKQVEDLMTSLQQMVDSRTDLRRNNMDDDAAAPATTSSLIEWHAQFPTLESERIDSVLKQLLLESSHLAYRGDVQMRSPLVLKALGFWLHAQGGLQSGVPDDLVGSFHVACGVLQSHLFLDRTAAECIHLLPPANEGVATFVGGQKHNNSLLGILSKPCATKMGKRLMEAWLRQPLVDLQAILKRQNAVTTLLDHGVQRDQLMEALRNFSGVDLNKLALQLGAYGGEDHHPDEAQAFGPTKTALQALYQLYLVSSDKLPRVLECLQSVTTNDKTSILETTAQNLETVLAELMRSQELAEAVLDLDEAPREFLIKSSYKEELRDIKQELIQVEAELQDCHDDMNQLWAETTNTSDTCQVRLESNDDTAWQFRLPDTNASKILQDELSHRVKVHRILKNGVYFSTKQLRELATKKQDLVAEYDRHQTAIVQDAMKVAATYQGSLERTSDLIAQLDVLCSLAHVAAYNPHGYCKPQLTDGDEPGLGIELQAARHPCVELQENVEFIPNDVKLTFGKSSFWIVTGPNMGGKSTYIRALGAIVTLAQIGSYVPCTSAKINICHHILARVGAGDLQDRGISTFMAEMLEASSILKTATKRSLIIIDELGRGTSTFDGYGLARAISEYILQSIGCFTVFATHFHELTALSHPCVQNCHVTAARGGQGLTFLYEVKSGPCLESFGIQVAEMAQVPLNVIADAKRKAKRLENFDHWKSKKQRTIQESPERIAAAKAFLDKFRQLPLATMGQVEKRSALLQLVQESKQ